MARIKTWLAVTSGLLLTACATTPPPSAVAQLPGHYSVSGKVAVNANEKGYNARFSWTHLASLDTVDVSNPLGQVLARLEMDASGARFFDSEGRLRTADDIEALSERELGWRLPARGLRYWLLGLAEPNTPAHWANDNEGSVLEQAGWTIRYPNLTKGSAPARITLNRTDLEVRIALYDWQLPTP